MMTLEDVQWAYNNAYQKYEETIDNKNNCLNKEYELKTDCQKKINLMNELNEQYKKYVQAQEDISGTNMRDRIESGLQSVNREFAEASEFFKSIAVSSENKPIDLSVHIFGNDENKAGSFVERIFYGINKAKADIDLNAEDLKEKINKLENEIQSINQYLKEIQNEIHSLESVKKKLINDMQIYKALEKKLMGGFIIS
ncbi:MAG: hypothetical protein PUH54_03605 [Oscillospiraceae bacterium]|nr:hypothetical protein [Oscillospiraceae bacterium]